MSNAPQFITHIRDLIAKNKIDTAIQELKKLLEGSPRLSEVLQQSARYHSIIKDKRLGVVDAAIANLEQNKISLGLLELLDLIVEEYSTKPDVKAEVEHYSQKNVVNQSSIHAGQNAIIGDGNTINQFLHNTPTSPARFLTQKPFYTDFFIGREQDLEKIEAEYLQHHHLLVLVNGEGGMGKTTLASRYWFTHEDRYKHLAWVFAESGVGNALVSLANSLGVQFEPQDNAEAQIKRIAHVLNNLESPCLLVLDNANNADDLEQHFGTLRRLSNCHILLTSRVTALSDVPVHRVLPLEPDDAIALFKKYYPKYSDSDAPLLHSLLHAVGFNTLVIELMAKNLAIFNKFQENYSLASLLADLQERGLFAVQSKAVKTIYQADTLRTETSDAIIAAMYDLATLSESERLILSNFAVLPAENIPYSLFSTLIISNTNSTQNVKKGFWDKLILFFFPSKKEINLNINDFDKTLSTLQQKGWIEFYDDSSEFKISPVIQYITKLKNKDTLLEDCYVLIRALTIELDYDNIHKDNYKMSTVFERYAESLVTAFDAPNYNLALLCNRIGRFYETVGNLDKALGFYEKGNDVSSKLCQIAPNNMDYKDILAISYQNLGITYSNLGNLGKALVFYNEYNRLEKELYAAHPTNVEFKNGLAISYNYLGNTHSDLGNLEKALKFYELYNQLSNELYDANPTNLAFKNNLSISYHKLGKTHSQLDNLDKGLQFYELSNQLLKEIYITNPTNVTFKNGLAISYNYLGNIHSNLGNLEKALEFYEKDLELSKELYATNPTNVTFKNGLAISYNYLGNTHSDLGNLDKALEFYELYNQLEQELYNTNPTNVTFKNNLAISYIKLGALNIDKLSDATKAVAYFQQAETLLLDLVRDAPLYVEFQKNLSIVQESLKELNQ